MLSFLLPNSHAQVIRGGSIFAFRLVECTNKYLLCASRAGSPVILSDDCGGRSHSDAIRAICFSVSGALFASAGDDKLVKVWKTDSWRCIRTM
jgi:tRNA (guanine-N(7)-)-methyltransferase subunit TRM82